LQSVVLEGDWRLMPEDLEGAKDGGEELFEDQLGLEL
jgi:hypothetical protein